MNITKIKIFLVTYIFFTLSVAWKTAYCVNNEHTQALINSANRYVALQTMGNSLKDFSNKIDQQKYTEDLSQEMLNQVNAHQNIYISKLASKKWLDGKLNEEWKSLSEGRMHQFEIDKKTYEDILKKLAGNFDTAKQSIINTRITDNPDSIFILARNKAITDQYKSLNSKAYPSLELVNKINNDGWTNTEIDEIKKKIEAGKTLFDENTDKVNGIVKTIIQDIDEQRQRQLDVINIEPPKDIVTQEVATLFLQKRLDEELAKARESTKQSGRIVYERLDKTNELIQTTALAIEQRRFIDFLATVMPQGITQQSLTREIEADLSGHKTYALSEQKLGEEIQAEMAKQAVENYTQQHSSGNDAKAFKQRLNEALNQKSANDALWNNVITVLKPELNIVRNNITQQQLKTYFTPLTKHQWKPSKATVEKIVLEKPDLSTYTFEDDEQLPGIKSNEAYRREQLLDETESKFQELANQAIQKGKNAWDKQTALVEQKKQSIEHDFAAINNADDLDDEPVWVNRFTSQVNTAWNTDDLANEYPELFNAKLEDIKRSVHALYRTTKTRIVVAHELTPAKSGGGTGTGGGRRDGHGSGDGGGGGGGGGGGKCDIKNMSNADRLNLINDIRMLVDSVPPPPRK